MSKAKYDVVVEKDGENYKVSANGTKGDLLKFHDYCSSAGAGPSRITEGSLTLNEAKLGDPLKDSHPSIPVIRSIADSERWPPSETRDETETRVMAEREEKRRTQERMRSSSWDRW
jgi:hypothetical protein